MTIAYDSSHGVAMLEAVLFDLDGTLVDTGPLWDDAIVEFTELNGATLGDDVVAKTHGMDSTEAMILAHKAVGWEKRDVNKDVAWMQGRVREKLESGVPWRPGARRLLTAVRDARIPTALVTATYRDLVTYILETLGAFDVIICGDDVENIKPHPEPYLAATRQLGVDPCYCVAIEDSPPESKALDERAALY